MSECGIHKPQLFYSIYISSPGAFVSYFVFYMITNNHCTYLHGLTGKVVGILQLPRQLELPIQTKFVFSSRHMLIPSVPWQAYHHVAVSRSSPSLKHGTIAHTGSLSCFFLDCFVIGSITSMLFVGLRFL